MSGNDRLSDLVDLWRTLRANGNPIAPELLCAECPELLEPLRQRIEALQTETRDLDAPTPPTLEAPPSQSVPTVAVGPRRPGEPARNWPRIPGYQILGELGRGGMGVVYKARQLSPGRMVAVKMILAGKQAGPVERARFRTEIEAVGRLQHPNIVQIYEVGEYEEQPYFSMEFVERRTLASRIACRPQPPREAARVVEVLARAMHAVHQQGLIHRDLKPDNVLLRWDDEPPPADAEPGAPPVPPGLDRCTPKITDFGLARRLHEATGPTRTGRAIGTPNYMAPEQALGRRELLGPATDVYALGAILYECLTGHPPFEAASAWDIVHLVTSAEPKTPRSLQPQVPRDLETICLKCLEKNPKKRYASALELAEDLRRFLAGEPIRARRVGRLERAVKWARRHPAAAALVLVSSLAVLALTAGGLVAHARVRQALHAAERSAEERRQCLVRLQVAEGARALEDDDWFTALVWFTEALRLDEAAGVSGEMHRIRIGAVLRQCPRLVQVWFHDGPVTQAQFSPAGDRVLTTSEDGTARVWESPNWDRVGPLLNHRAPIRHGCFSPDGNRIVTAGGDGLAKTWEVAAGDEPTRILRHGAPLTCACFHPDGRSVLTAGEDGAARLWDAATGEPLEGPWRHDKGPIHWAAFSPDGRRVVTAGEDGTARLWSTDGGQPTPAVLRHRGPVLHAAFSPDGQRLATASADATARLWNAPSGKPLGDESLDHAAAVVHVAFSRDGRRLATASADRTAYVWDLATGDPWTPPLRQGSVSNSAEFSPDDAWVVTASGDNSARVWNADTGEPATPLLNQSGTVHKATFCPNPAVPFVVTAGLDGTARLWDVTPGRSFPTGGKKDLARAAGATPAGRWTSRDGRRVVVAEKDHRAQVRDAQTGAAIGAPLQHGSTITYAAFSADDGRLVTGSDDNTARIWDVETGELLTPPLKHRGTVCFAAFSPDGRMVLTASDARMARVWDAALGEPLTPPVPFAGRVQDLSFNAAGDQVRVPGEGRSVWTWDLRPDGRPLAELQRLAGVLAGSELNAAQGLVPRDSCLLRPTWTVLRMRYLRDDPGR
jgi:WD40 repeat protein